MRPPKTPKLSEEAMILHFYGEAADPERIESDLAADPELREQYESLRRELAALPKLEAPPVAPDLAARVWTNLRPQLVPYRPRRPWLDRLRFEVSLRPGFALAAAATLALAVGFLLGRGGPAPESSIEAHLEALSPAARERLLFASVSEHFDGSARLLTAIANAPAEGDDLADESRWAADLAVSNRLYRSAAERAGQRRIVALLDELEPLLLELANSPSDSADDLTATQRRIDDNDLLFKLRVAGDRLERSSRPASRASGSTATS
jgi:hypothetical protein